MKPPQSRHESFLSLLEMHQRALLKVCWAYGRTSHDRDDLLQEIIERLWKSFATYDPARRFSTWMYRVALNVAIDFQRRKRRWGREAASLDDHSEAGSASAADESAREQMDELRELLDQQTDDDRALLLLCLEGRSYREIGDILGISETNVGTRLNRLKKSLRDAVLDA